MPITKPLVGVSRLVARGNRVVFEPGGSYLEQVSSGRRLYFEEKGRVYVLRVWKDESRLPREDVPRSGPKKRRKKRAAKTAQHVET